MQESVSEPDQSRRALGDKGRQDSDLAMRTSAAAIWPNSPRARTPQRAACAALRPLGFPPQPAGCTPAWDEEDTVALGVVGGGFGAAHRASRARAGEKGGDLCGRTGGGAALAG